MNYKRIYVVQYYQPSIEYTSLNFESYPRWNLCTSKATPHRRTATICTSWADKGTPLAAKLSQRRFVLLLSIRGRTYMNNCRNSNSKRSPDTRMLRYLKLDDLARAEAIDPWFTPIKNRIPYAYEYLCTLLYVTWTAIRIVPTAFAHNTWVPLTTYLAIYYSLRTI